MSDNQDASFFFVSFHAYITKMKCKSAESAGEWGGHCNPGTPDYAWHEQLANFLIDRGLTCNFYWYAVTSMLGAA